MKFVKWIKNHGNILKKESISEIQNNLFWMYNYGKMNIFSIIIYTLLGLTGTVISLVSGLVSKDLIDIITGHNTGKLLEKFVLMIVSQLLSMIISQLSAYISTKLTLKVTNYIQADVYDRIMQTEWESLSSFHSGDLMSRWSGDVAAISNGMLTTIPRLLIMLFQLGSAFIMVVSYDPSFAIIPIISVPISFMISRKNLKRLQQANMNGLSANTRMSQFTQESFGNYQTLKALDLLKLYSRRLKEIQNDVTDVRMNYQKVNIFNSIILTLMSLLVTYSTYGWGVYKVWNGEITYGMMTLFLSLSSSLSSSINSLLTFIPSTLTVLNSVKRVRDVLDLPKENYDKYEEVSLFYEKYKEKGLGIHVRDINYAYSNGTEVFAGVSFDAHPYETIALVGPSGEGKTTMLRLLLSIIKEQEGKGYICPGNEMPEMCKDTLELSASTRQLFAYVPQGNTMFSGTIAENMRNVCEDATDLEIENALKLACAWKFVNKLPEGIDTVIQERGGGFSEGQAQRLSIARALLRKSPILLLDEATSALDQATERELINNIARDSYPRTTILTTHRPSILANCSKVYSINQKNCSILSEEDIYKLMYPSE